jgi:hypothetical protein
MAEAVLTSETSVNFYKTTLRNIAKGCPLHTRRRENQKSHKSYFVFIAFELQNEPAIVKFQTNR